MKKNLVLTIAICVLFTCNGFGQRNQLQGPAAKNYKSWQDSKSETTIVVTEKKQLQGPEAKNHKPWKDEDEKFSMVYVERSDLKGPNAKNKRSERTTYEVVSRR